MFRVLFVLFIIIPIIEISVLMQVGELLGMWPTIGIVILSAWIGAKYVRQQGLATLQSVQAKMAQGEMPSSEIVTGLMLLVAGVLLVTPGFVTDILGLSLLIPSVRQVIAASVQKHIKVNPHVTGNSAGASFHTGNTYENEDFSHTPNPDNKVIPQHHSETIEGEYTRKE
ncbi:FxsA family protein [Candidatus Colwellia aromaticivorans]|uniref:FxsA family protein n=1 Tax=Candidatus Colwellia aromaticivorans TaxID=2267621 RepID=UPI000DF36C4C|nr:FxsA family protein [Candidatus Colwellia aromaticivorans]